MFVLTAAQLRHKRRDRTWKLWIQRSDELERKLSKLLRKYFEAERGRVIRRLLTRIHLRAAETDEASDDLEPLSIIEVRKALNQELQENNDDWDDVLLMLLLLVATQFSYTTQTELGYPPQGTPQETKAWARTFIDATLTLIAATTLKKIISVIADAQQKKQSTEATITRINDAYSTFVQNRVPGIAGDMVGKVASMAQQIAVLSLGIDPESVRQTWVSMRDKRVRESHQELDGVTRAMGEEFKSDLKFPRDPDAPLEETAGCRCWLMVEQVRKSRKKAA